MSLDGTPLSGVALVEMLNDLAGKAGVGRVDMIEDRLVGFKSREVYECPAAMTLIAAHRALETLTLSKEVLKVKRDLETKYAELTYEGYWFSPLKDALDAFIDATQKTVSGVVRVRLYKGQATVTGMKSDQSLYREDLATYSEGDTFDHQSAVGFIKVWGFPSRPGDRPIRRPRGSRRRGWRAWGRSAVWTAEPLRGSRKPEDPVSAGSSFFCSPPPGTVRRREGRFTKGAGKTNPP